MEHLELKPRSSGKDTKPHQLRRQGVLPIAVVSSGKGTMLAQMDRAAFESAMGHNEGVAKFMAKMEGEPRPFEVLVREVQKHPLDRKTIHAVLQRVSESDVVKVPVRIVVHGDPVGVSKGLATITQVTDTIELKGELGKIPETIEVDASQLGDDDKIAVSDLPLPEGVECMSSGDATVVTTQTIRSRAGDVEAEAAEAGAEGAEAAGEAPAADSESE